MALTSFNLGERSERNGYSQKGQANDILLLIIIYNNNNNDDDNVSVK